VAWSSSYSDELHELTHLRVVSSFHLDKVGSPPPVAQLVTQTLLELAKSLSSLCRGLCATLVDSKYSLGEAVVLVEHDARQYKSASLKLVKPAPHDVLQVGPLLISEELMKIRLFVVM
jgi:hypothetical protein